MYINGPLGNPLKEFIVSTYSYVMFINLIVVDEHLALNAVAIVKSLKY